MGPLRKFEFISVLKVHPTAGVCLEVPGQAQCRLSSDPTAAANDIVDPSRRHTDGPGKPGGRQVERFHEIVLQNLTRVYWRKSGHEYISSIDNNSISAGQ